MKILFFFYDFEYKLINLREKITMKKKLLFYENNVATL